jgi:hypothetical protein
MSRPRFLADQDFNENILRRQLPYNERRVDCSPRAMPLYRENTSCNCAE